MNRERPPHLRVIPAGDAPPVAADERAARQQASHWHVRLREEPQDAALQARFAAWRGRDPLHGAAWDSLCRTMAAADRAPAAWRSPTKRRKRMAYAAAAGIAACALLVALPALRLRVQADHLTSTAEVRQVQLQDGSTVQLGPDSAIAVDYDRGARRVRLLSGQAMFDVVPDPARPFRVTAGEVTTTVLGTAFDVRMIGCETSVAVSRGHVRVENAAAGPAASLDLRAGEWIRIGADAAAQTGSIAPTLVGGWQQAQVLAENRTIGSVVDEIRPWYAGRIVVIDAALAGRPVTGVYSLRDPVQALTLLVAPHGGRVTRITPWLLMVSAP